MNMCSYETEDEKDGRSERKRKKRRACLNRVAVPDPSMPNNKSFWTLPCSKYSGTDLVEWLVELSLTPGGLVGGTGNENNEQMKRVDVCLP